MQLCKEDLKKIPEPKKGHPNYYSLDRKVNMVDYKYFLTVQYGRSKSRKQKEIPLCEKCSQKIQKYNTTVRGK